MAVDMFLVTKCKIVHKLTFGTKKYFWITFWPFMTIGTLLLSWQNELTFATKILNKNIDAKKCNVVGHETFLQRDFASINVCSYSTCSWRTQLRHPPSYSTLEMFFLSFLFYFASQHRLRRFWCTNNASSFLLCPVRARFHCMWSVQSRLQHVVYSVSDWARGHFSLGFIAQSRLHRMVTSVSASWRGYLSLGFIAWSL